MRIFLFGAGYSARALARRMTGQDVAVGGTTRSADNFPRLRAAGIEPFAYAGGPFPEAMLSVLRETTHLVISAAPDASGDPFLAAADEVIAEEMPALKWIGYLSTVGVYGNRDGGWVNEEGVLDPGPSRSSARVIAEQGWLDLGRRTGLPVAVLRLSGIYGPGRNAFVNLQRGTARRVIKPGQVFNRIHADDIAGSLAFLAERRQGGVFNVTDSEPAPPQDVVAFAAALMGVEPPPEIPFDQAQMTAMARSFYGENKRVANAKLRATGYAFRFPDYRTALRSMWETQSWERESPAVREVEVPR